MKKNAMATAQAEVGAMESAMELSFSALNKAFGAVFQETMKFKQALRVFDGMGGLNVPVSKSKTMKFADILAMCRVVYKAGKIDPKSVMEMWGIRTEDNYMAIYKNIAGVEAHNPNDTENKPRRVYTFDEEKKEWVGISKVGIVAVEKWNARTILRGILQTAFLAKYQKLAAESEAAWAAFEGPLYVFDKVQDKDGVTNRKMAISKSRVVF